MEMQPDALEESQGSGLSVCSFFGYLDSPEDCALVITACFNGSGLAVPVQTRLTNAQKDAIDSGTCFVFKEEESGIRRWTDRFKWTKSRLDGINAFCSGQQIR